MCVSLEINKNVTIYGQHSAIGYIILIYDIFSMNNRIIIKSVSGIFHDDYSDTSLVELIKYSIKFPYEFWNHYMGELLSVLIKVNELIYIKTYGNN